MASCDIPFIDLSQLQLDSRVVQLLPEVYARRYRALVVHDDGERLTLAMSDPADLAAIDTLAYF